MVTGSIIFLMYIPYTLLMSFFGPVGKTLFSGIEWVTKRSSHCQI